MILYTTHCPKCEVLKQKLDMANIQYEICDNMEEMLKLGIRMAPMLEKDGELLDFSKSIAWLKEVE